MKPFVLTTIIFMTLSVFAGRASFSVLVLDSETDQPIIVLARVNRGKSQDSPWSSTAA